MSLRLSVNQRLAKLAVRVLAVELGVGNRLTFFTTSIYYKTTYKNLIARVIVLAQALLLSEHSIFINTVSRSKS